MPTTADFTRNLEAANPSARPADPVSSLTGVSARSAEILDQVFGIATIQDLAVSSHFLAATQIADAVTDNRSDATRRLPIPPDLLDRNALLTPPSKLALSSTSALASIGVKKAAALSSELGLTTIADLAKWPPYLEARSLLSAAIGSSPAREAGEGVPNDLVPVNGRFPTERVQYEVLIFDDFIGSNLAAQQAATPLGDAGQLDISAVLAGDIGYERPATGGLLTFTQSWYSQALALGTLLHSVALAPGESTRIAMIDWSRTSTASTSESISEGETLYSTLDRTRAINEITSSVAQETQRGDSGARAHSQASQYGESTGGSTYGFRNNDWTGSVGDFVSNLMNDTPQTTTKGTSFSSASGDTDTTTWTTASSERNVSAQLLQDITDRTQQASQIVRGRRASIVREVSQKEAESITTRTVSNYNHMHALTMQYYEVVQLNRTVTELTKVDRCVFVPMKFVDFDDARILARYRRLIASNGLTASVRALMLAEPDHTIISAPFLSGSWDAASVSALSEYLGSPVGSPTDPILVVPDGSFKVAQVFFDKTAPFDELIFNHRTGSTTRVALTLSDDVQIGGVQAFLHLAKSQEMDLSGLVSVQVRKKAGQEGYSGKLAMGMLGFGVGSNEFRIVHWSIDVPADLTTISVLELGRTTGSAELIQHLNSNRLYYSQKIWRSLDPSVLGMILARYSVKIAGVDRSLLGLADPSPVAMAANYLIFRLSGDSGDANEEWLARKGLLLGSCTEDVVPVPSGGVFGEAVLGRANSAEKLDITRFWNWQDSPIPNQAPEIAAIASGTRATQDDLVPSALGAPVLNIVNSPSLPDPQGMGAVLAAVQNGNMFRDVSGLAATIGLAQAGLSGASQAATGAAAQAGANAATAAQLNSSITGALIRLIADYASSGASGSSGSDTKGLSGQGAKVNLGRDLDARGVGSEDGSSDGAATSQGSSNETAAFKSTLGGGSGPLGALLSMLVGATAGDTKGSSSDAGGVGSHYTLSSGVEITDAVEAAVGKLADVFFGKTKKTLVVTDGTRDADDQADRMYKKLKAGDDLSEYTAVSAKDAIKKAYDDSTAAGDGAETTKAAMAAVIKDQIAKGVYISKHLQAGAVDIRCKDMTAEEQKEFKASVEEEGSFSYPPLLEAIPPHWHLQMS